ncbi:hypothetical protein EDM57_04235 [Brevibacillus gelatini]|uniref:Uncharacterized protein n=1 Tax=Brevibacillus gelatini TaxID=1655277 RepID=A0A3M8B8N5_9BACL|nr:hypothetical protein [Brevibacillus gelatini]RNB59357.1 hypothetical protein EDM57_04235 [Brevibacillus gelatini]
MKIYKLNKYDWVHDFYCYEGTDPEKVAQKAIELSTESGDFYTYRMETWENGELKFQFRFFQNGRELTSDLIKAFL